MTNRNVSTKLNNVNKELNKLAGSKSKSLRNRISSFSLKSNSNSNSNSKGGLNKVFIIIGVILLVIVLAIAGYFLYNYYKDSPNSVQNKLLIPYIHDAGIYKQFTSSNIPSSISGNEYNINVWLYINDLKHRYDEDKCLLYLGDKLENGFVNMCDSHVQECNPSIWLKARENTLVVKIGLNKNEYDYSVTVPASGNEVAYNLNHADTPFIPSNDCPNVNSVDKCEFKNFPLQRWVNLNMALRNNVVDIFIDGTLVKSCILKGPPIPSVGGLHVCHEGSSGYAGFNGYVSRLEYTNAALSHEEIMSRYKNGPVVNVSNSFFNFF
jgi:F0F1-type ATP synthase assembly protein I